ncbi:serine hydrolase [Microcoleus sp. D3_18_C4]|uniref:serine hydrolase n=1 Tax=Microcoleus sp. D3_18_C4 TaxID=3055335 RepID=UPI002FD2CBB6
MFTNQNKLLILTVASISIVCVSLFSVWQLYFSPKLSLFDPNKRAANFRNMGKIFPSKQIYSSNNPYHFKENLHLLDVSYKFEDQYYQMSELLKKTETTGILVVKDGTIVYEKYFQGNSALYKNTSWSMAKSFTSALVGIAIADGYIDSINDSITKYIPELAESGYRNVPIKHILQMSSGVKFSENYDDESSDINNLLPQLFLYMQPIKKVVLNFPSDYPSGKRFNYISLDTQVLGLLIERVTGQSISSYFQTKLWQPLGAESDALWLTDNHHTELTFCCLNATLRDYAKFGLLYLHEGYFNGKQIIPQAWVKKSVAPDSPYLQVGSTAEEYGKWGYQYQWWIPTDSNGDYSAVGVWGQYIYINPKENLVIVKTSSDLTKPKDDDEVMALFRAIAKELK